MLLQSLDFSGKNFELETAAERNNSQRFRFDVDFGACLACTSVQPHSGEGLVLVVLNVKCCQKTGTWYFISLISLLHTFSPAPFTDFISFFPLFYLAVPPHFLTASAALEALLSSLPLYFPVISE